MAPTFVQSLGSVALAGALVLLARGLGPERQGMFSVVKAQLDFAVAVCLVGLPQALFYFVQGGKVSVASARKLALQHAGAAAVTTLTIALLLMHLVADVDLKFGHVMLLAAVVPFAVLYSDLRASALAVRSNSSFALLSALPNVAILTCSAVTVVVYRQGAVIGDDAWMILLPSYLVSAAASWVAMHVKDSRAAPPLSVSAMRELTRYGVATWIPALCQAGSTVLVLRWVQEMSPEGPALAVISTGLAFVAMVTAPVGLLSPLLFKHWALLDSHTRSAQLRRGQVLALAAFAVGWVAFWPLEDDFVGLIFGSAYTAYPGVYSVLALAVFPQIVAKLWGVAASASGTPSVMAFAEVFRFACILAGIIAFGTTLWSAAIVWVTGEYLALVVGYLLLRKSRVLRAAQ